MKETPKLFRLALLFVALAGGLALYSVTGDQSGQSEAKPQDKPLAGRLDQVQNPDRPRLCATMWHSRAKRW